MATLGLCPWPGEFQLGALHSAWAQPSGWCLPKNFATVTLTSSAWSFPFFWGKWGPLVIFSFIFYKLFWGVKIDFLIFGGVFF